MRYKFIMPYLLTGATMFLGPTGSTRSNAAKPAGTMPPAKTQVASKDNKSQDVDSTVVINTMPQLMDVAEQGKSVIYSYDDGTSVVRQPDGTRAWRNNNPGNLRYYQFAKDHGAIGEAGGFAVFPDEETGMAALQALLQSDSYDHLTIANALKRYEPKNYIKYTQRLTRLTGLSANTVLGKLNMEQLRVVVNTIRQLEGWKPGTEVVKEDPAIKASKAYNAVCLAGHQQSKTM